jgi:ABC-type bacteriocin/lantibiotic exporter with double-glycine peptidase domain
LDDQTALTIYETLLNLDKTVILVAHRHLDYLNQRFKIKLELTKAGAHHA